MKGVLDRIENQLAVILIEDINKEIIIPMKDLPPNSQEGTWFDLEELEGEIKIISIDHDLTQKEAQKSQDLLNQLRTKSKGSKFKRKS